MYAFLCLSKPKSLQGNSDPAYTERIQEAFAAYHPDAILLEDELYGVIYYFHKVRSDIDTDNIAKKIWDALTTVAYSDDRLIKLSITGQIDLNKAGLQQLDLTHMPTPVVEDLIRMIDNQEHILYVEIGAFSHTMDSFGLEEAAK